MPQTFKQLLAGDELIRVFAAGRLIHPAMYDVYGMVGGFHGFWMDQEHAGVTYEQIVLSAMCGKAYGFDNFVRMPLTGYWQATQNLEAGAGGLMGARIETVEQAREFIGWTKFAPEGNRGVNLSGRDGLYGGKAGAKFVADANRGGLVVVQIETLGALDKADEIAALPGLDMLFVGPSDLSMELGVFGQLESDELWDAYTRVDKACRRHGRAWATIAMNPAFAQRAVDLGCRMLSFGIDIVALRRGVEKFKDTFSNFFA
jgi:2-keto-3-deoxy-L-rhamnonate aldolase RhmA